MKSFMNKLVLCLLTTTLVACVHKKNVDPNVSHITFRCHTPQNGTSTIIVSLPELQDQAITYNKKVQKLINGQKKAAKKDYQPFIEKRIALNGDIFIVSYNPILNSYSKTISLQGQISCYRNGGYSINNQNMYPTGVVRNPFQIMNINYIKPIIYFGNDNYKTEIMN